MSFPPVDQSSNKLISDTTVTNTTSISYETLTQNHTRDLTAENVNETISCVQQSTTQHDAIDSQPSTDDAKNVPPGSSITRVYKKCASNGSLAVYVGTRTLTVEGLKLEALKGVLVLDKDSLAENLSPNFKIWAQITLTFRYGREDEEVLGLRFCNEAILALKQLWPPMSAENTENSTLPIQDENEELTPLQVVLLERINASSNSPSICSIAFTLCAGPVGLGSFPPPPSVLLAPAKPYKGSPIGTIYDLRVYASCFGPEERPPRRNLIRLALRAVQIPNPSLELVLQGSIESRPTFLSRGKIRLSCELDKNAVRYGEPLEVKIIVQNSSRSSIRKIVVSLIQVDVCMFTSGKFKNVVGLFEDAILLVPGASCQKIYRLTPCRGPARQWLALEEAFGREPILAPSTSMMETSSEIETAATTTSPDATLKSSSNCRNVFAIIVSYYVKAKLVLGGLSLCQVQNIKVPFILLPPQIPDDPDPYPSPRRAQILETQQTTTEISREMFSRAFGSSEDQTDARDSPSTQPKQKHQ